MPSSSAVAACYRPAEARQRAARALEVLGKDGRKLILSEVITLALSFGNGKRGRG